MSKLVQEFNAEDEATMREAHKAHARCSFVPIFRGSHGGRGNLVVPARSHLNCWSLLSGVRWNSPSNPHRPTKKALAALAGQS